MAAKPSERLVQRRIDAGWDPEKARNTPPLSKSAAAKLNNRKSPWRGHQDFLFRKPNKR